MHSSPRFALVSKLAFTTLLILTCSPVAWANGIDVPFVIISGIAILIPLIAFEVFIEAIFLAYGLRTPYRKALWISFTANAVSCVVGIFPMAFSLGVVGYFIVTMATELVVVIRATKTLPVSRKRTAVTVLLANLATYAVLVPILLTVTRVEPRYYLPSAKWKLRQFSDYLEGLREDRTRWSEIPKYDGDYPLNEKIVVKDVSHYVIGKDYRLPYNWSMSPEQMAHEEKFEGMYFADFMYDGFRYSRKSDGRLIQYISNGKWFVLVSCGPDKEFEYKWLDEIERNKKTLTKEGFRASLVKIAYDPTNGIISRGDIVITSDNLGMPINKSSYWNY